LWHEKQLDFSNDIASGVPDHNGTANIVEIMKIMTFIFYYKKTQITLDLFN